MPKGNFEFQSKTPNPYFPGVYDISPQELLNVKEKVRLIDVRRPDEFDGELGHIPGAELITLDFIPQKIKDLPQDHPIVFICRSGGRSGQASAFALENGFTQVYNLKGGMLLWNELGLVTETHI